MGNWINIGGRGRDIYRKKEGSEGNGPEPYDLRYKGKENSVNPCAGEIFRFLAKC